MIITDKFVYVHMPKTGGTFVETVLRKIHEKRGDDIQHRRSDRQPPRRRIGDWFKKPRPVYLDLINLTGENDWNQHGRVQQIPPEHRHKPVLTTLRNPFDRYVSQYEFKWWKDHPASFFRNVVEMKSKFPHYPDITFEEFVRIANTYSADEMPQLFPPEDRLGRHSIQFVKYFFPDPSALAQMDAAYLAQQRYKAEIPSNIHFTFTHDLNRQLYDFLLKMEYPHEEIAFIVNHQKVFPQGSGRSEDQKWETYYTPELKAYVRHHERLLFDMFPEFES